MRWVLILLDLAALALLRHGATGANVTTSSAEVEALRILEEKLQAGSSWNFSIDPCSGEQGWNTVGGQFQPSKGITCNCNSSVCHVTEIAVVARSAGGFIPPEIGNFPFLRNLKLGQNLLTGELPEELGKLSRLEYLSLELNRFTGSIPASFGNLTALKSLGIGLNFLNGSLPKQMGNMVSLEQIYLDSNSLTGEIPAEFANLKRLQVMNLNDNNLTGPIPDFLGGLTSLQEVILYGNSFRGQIPLNIANLTGLRTLLIGDVASGGIIPPGLDQLVNLTTLSLRDCELVGSIPAFSNPESSLKYLDLSFNRLSGQVPASLGSLPSLETLLLANNNLSGHFVLEVPRNLTHLDISFNSFTGPLPSWVNGNNTQRNIIGNNFDVPGSDGKAKECLEAENLVCNNFSEKRNSDLAINCGGSEVRVPDSGVTFSDDSASLFTGTYYSTMGPSWAVSSSGYPVREVFQPAVRTTLPVTGAQAYPDSLYQSARASLSSIRYFGLGMPNGPYVVDLHFAEIVMPNNGSDWSGLPRRFFDIYLQESVVIKDFNIQKEAGGSYRALVKSFNVTVSNNMLSIHLLWNGKGSCCSPSPNSFGPLISAIKVSPAGSSSSGGSSNAVKIGVGVGAAGLLLLVIILLSGFLLVRRRRHRKASKEEKELYDTFKPKLNLISYSELRNATGDFSSENKVGGGAFGTVYKGVLADGTTVAVKQLSHISSQGTREFMNEVSTISAVKHRNLVKLHGCCIEDDHRILVYEYLENNSIHEVLFERAREKPLDWPTRFQIILGIARGIAYLHEESRPRIIHRDIKASNILLDATLTPKISDFGLAKLFSDFDSHVSTRVAGTIGYLAPEYAMLGHLSEKADVYSFGVLLLEIVSGRRNFDSSLRQEQVYLVEWVWALYDLDQLFHIIDEGIDELDEQEAVRAIQVAMLCIQSAASTRPSMGQVVAMLTGAAAVNLSLVQPTYFAALKTAAAANVLISHENTASSFEEMSLSAYEPR